MRLNALLTAERARNEKLLNELQDLVGITPAHVKSEKASPQSSVSAPAQIKNSPFAFLHRKGSLTAGGSEAPLSTTTAFTLSQMQALRALSTSLRTITPDLVPSTSAAEAMDVDTDNDGDKDKERKSWRRERLEYVEGATRRYLETVEGLELGRHGEVRDGEWQGAGRGLARDEVGGLEGVITLLGGDEEEEREQQENNSSGTARRSASSLRDDRMDES
ncbi:mind kinetochore complex component [Daldinia childiae]|nr:mind kinetochore complex component [Daldinia childiae]KAF3064431.1 mind kinetochore complex component [Daldinia childiae]